MKMTIDTSKIPGYEALTPKQTAAIEAIDFPDEQDESGYVKQEVFEKPPTEAARWKKTPNEHTSEYAAKQHDDE